MHLKLAFALFCLILINGAFCEGVKKVEKKGKPKESKEELVIKSIEEIRARTKGTNMNKLTTIDIKKEGAAFENALKNLATKTCQSKANLDVGGESKLKDFFFIQLKSERTEADIPRTIVSTLMNVLGAFNTKTLQCAVNKPTEECNIAKAIYTAGFTHVVTHVTDTNKKCPGSVVVTIGFKPKAGFAPSKIPYSKSARCGKGWTYDKKALLCIKGSSSGSAMKSSTMSVLALCLIGFQLVTGVLLRN